jgi:hypothetical protein
MKTKKLYTLIILTMLLTSTFMSLYRVPPAKATTYFYDGFEDGTHDAWDSEVGTVDINDEDPIVGVYSANITVTTNAGQANYLTHTESQTVLFFSAWYYIETLSLPNEEYPYVSRISIMEIATGGPGKVAIGIIQDGGFYYWGYQAGETWYYNWDIQVQEGLYQIEISANASITNHLYGKVQVDGDLIGEVDWYTVYPHNPTSGKIGSIQYAGANDPTLIASFDECKFDDVPMVASIPFTSDFEDPSLEEWSFVKDLNITDSWSYSGTHSLYNPSTDYGFVTKWLPRASLYYVSAYWRWTSFPTGMSPMFIIANDEDVSTIQVNAYWNGTEEHLVVGCHTVGEGSEAFEGTTPLSVDTTYNIVLKAEVSQVEEENATVTLWLNDAVEINASVNNYADTNLFNFAEIYFDYVNEVEGKYVDLFTVTETYAPPPPEELTATVSPSNATINRNTTQTFSVTASGGTPPYTYAWYVNGSPAMRESGVELITNSGFETGNLNGWQHNIYADIERDFVHSGTYSCQIYHSGDEQGYIRQTFGGVPQDKIVSIGYWQRSVGLGQLGLVTIEYNDETTTVVEADTTGYTWEYVDLLPYVEVGKTVTALNFSHNGLMSPYFYVDDISFIPEEIPETSQTLNFRTENLGFYEIWCNVTDATDATVKSNVANCTVEAGSLEITVSPSDITLDLGEYENASASVVGGTPPLQYQWYRNGTTAVGTNSSTYEVNATAWGVGVWTLHCNVTDDNSIENKSNIINVYISEGVLTVNISPTGTVNKYLGQQTNFTSSVSGGIPPYTYEWYVNNELKGTASTYNLLPEATGSYAVKLKVYDSGINSQWSSTTTVVLSYPTVSLVPILTSTRVNIGKTYTCTATPAGLGNYAFLYYMNGESVYNSTEGTDNVNQYTLVPTESDIYEIYVSVRFTTLIDPYERDSNTVTLYVFKPIQRIPAIVSRLTTTNVQVPVGHMAQKSAFSVGDYYWQFYFDGYLDSYGQLQAYLRYKYSMDTQMWVEPAGSPFSGSKIFTNLPFWMPGGSPAVYHGWAGGVPFTLYYDNESELLYLIYSSGTSTGSRSLKMVTATFNETAVDWNWGTPETITTYSSPRLPVCPTMILANNGNPFIAFYLSNGGPGGALYHRVIAYYNGTAWYLNPTGDPSSWSSSAVALKLFNVGTKVYFTGFAAWTTIGYFDTTTQTLTEGWQVSYQMMIPNDSELWNLASFIDYVRLVARVRVDGYLASDEVAELHLDVYDGTHWINNVASGNPDWLFYPIELGEFITGGKYVSEYLPTDINLRNSRVRFWFTSPRELTCTIDEVYLELENSFGYVIETVPVVNYTESHDLGRTWLTLHVDGYTGEESDWQKVGSSPYLNGYNDGSYINTTTPNAVDSAYTFENMTYGGGWYPCPTGGIVHGAYLYIHEASEIQVNNYVDVYVYDGTSWHYAHEYPIGDPRSWYIDVTSILNTYDKVNNAALKFVHRDVSAYFSIDYAELIVDYDYVEFPDNWVTNGNTPYLDTVGSGNVSVTQGPVDIFCYNTGQTKSMPVPNMISYFNFTNAFTTITHSVNTTSPIYIFWYDPVDVVFQNSPNGYLSAFLVAETAQTLIRDEAGFTNMDFRHDYLGTWEDEGEWWNYTLWYMNLTSDINNVFDAKALGSRAGFSSRYIFWNDTLGDYQYEWVNQTDGLYWATTLASSLTLDGTPLCFHYYQKGMYATLYNGYFWDVRKILEENSTILRMNYGEGRCFSYTIQTSSYDVKFFMPFVKVMMKAQTMDGEELSPVGVVMNGELVYTPYNNNYDVVGLYSLTLYPEHVYFTQNDTIYAFAYYIVEASPAVQYNTAHFEMNVTGDVIITIVYGVGGAPHIPSEVTPPPPVEIIYCLPLIFYILMIVMFFVGLYLYNKRETWKISVPLLPIALWLLIFQPKTPIDQMPLAFLRYFTVPPWHLYMAIILTIIACVALLSKKEK